MFTLRAIISVPVALLCYVFFIVVTSIFCKWFFDRPEEWPYLIPIITSFFPMFMACIIAEEKFSSKSGAKITAIIIAAFWIIFVVADITGIFDDIIAVLMLFMDVLLNSKIFAVVSCIVASMFVKE